MRDEDCGMSEMLMQKSAGHRIGLSDGKEKKRKIIHETKTMEKC